MSRSDQTRANFSRLTFSATIASLLVCAFATFSCKARKDGSGLQDLNQGRALSDRTDLMNSPEMLQKKVVLIFYANDTYAPTDDDQANVNKEALVSKIREGLQANLTPEQKTKLTKTAARINDDWNLFRRTVDVDVAGLTNRICRSNPKYPMGLAVFRNFGNDASASRSDNMAFGYERQLSWSSCKPGERANLETLSVPHFDDFRYQSQPFSHPHVFRKALEEVMRVFPPANYRYILVTKSHGNREMVISPHLSVDVRNMPAETIWKAVISGSSESAGLDSSKGDSPILADIDSLLVNTPAVAQAASETPSGDRAGAIPPALGVSKKDFLQLLYSYGGGDPRLGMYFPIVFMEACKSALELSKNRELQKALDDGNGKYTGLKMDNIGYLYTSDANGLGYNTLDYQDLWLGFKYNGMTDFQQAIIRALDERAKR